MTVLVDNARWMWQGRPWAHMASDDCYDELHELARTIGKRRLSFQGDHYDVDESDRPRALAAGAVAVDSRILVRRLRAAGLRRIGPKPRWDQLASSQPGQPLNELLTILDGLDDRLFPADSHDTPTDGRLLSADSHDTSAGCNLNTDNTDSYNPHIKNPYIGVSLSTASAGTENPHIESNLNNAGTENRVADGDNPHTGDNLSSTGTENRVTVGRCGVKRLRIALADLEQLAVAGAVGVYRNDDRLAALIDLPPSLAPGVTALNCLSVERIVDLMWVGGPRRDGYRSVELFVRL